MRGGTKGQHGKTSFRARLTSAESRSCIMSLNWKTSLSTRAGGQTWVVSACSSTRMDTPQLNALTRLARRLTKKRGQLQIITHRGAPTTSKSLGTRMGNGKGKVINHRRWWSSGFVFARVVTPTEMLPRWLNVLDKRCGAKLVVRQVGY